MYTYIHVYIQQMLNLTDGKRDICAIEYSKVPGLNGLDTPPGTKLTVRNVRIVGGVLLLDQNNCKVEGGIVQSLRDEWETQRVSVYICAYVKVCLYVSVCVHMTSWRGCIA